jgi:hypothetical protein
LLNQIIQRAESFLQKSRWVHIDEENLALFVDSMWQKTRETPIDLPKWDGDAFLPHLSSLEEVSQFFFVGCAINFCFWKTSYTNVFQYKNYQGSEAMWKMISQWPELLDMTKLSNLTETEFKERAHDIPMIYERVQNLREIGKTLSHQFHGKVIHMLEESHFNANKIVETIVRFFPRWNDTYENVLFYKRAQLFVAMLAGRFQEEKHIKGIDSLSILADYHIPKGLHQLGIMKYDRDLQNRINQFKLITANSQEELEIRSATLIAGDQITKKLNARGAQITAIEVDAYLYSLAKQIKKPYHLTETIFY